MHVYNIFLSIKCFIWEVFSSVWLSTWLHTWSVRSGSVWLPSHLDGPHLLLFILRAVSTPLCHFKSGAVSLSVAGSRPKYTLSVSGCVCLLRAAGMTDSTRGTSEPTGRRINTNSKLTIFPNLKVKVFLNTFTILQA